MSPQKRKNTENTEEVPKKKRQQQKSIIDFVPNYSCSSSTSSTFQVIKTVVILAIVYKYTNLTNGKVYIGQTIDEDNRKKNWLGNHHSSTCGYGLMKIDRDKGHKFKYEVVVEKKFEVPYKITKDNITVRDKNKLKEISDWLHDKERHYIYICKSLYTMGGYNINSENGKCPKRYIQWIVLDIILSRRWNNKIKPDFQKYYDEHGHLNISTKHPKLGRIVDRIRSRESWIKSHPERLNWLLEKGFLMCYDTNYRWEHEIKPAFQKYYDEHGHLNISTKHPKLRSIVDGIRCRKDWIKSHPERLNWLLEKGFLMCYDTNYRWKHEIKPAFQKYYDEHGHLNISTKHPKLGRIVDRIRSRESWIKSHPERLNWLLEKGFLMCYDTNYRWEHEIKPAFQKYYDEHGHLNISTKHPKLRSIVDGIRCRKDWIKSHPERLNWLLEKGFVVAFLKSKKAGKSALQRHWSILPQNWTNEKKLESVKKTWNSNCNIGKKIWAFGTVNELEQECKRLYF